MYHQTSEEYHQKSYSSCEKRFFSSQQKLLSLHVCSGSHAPFSSPERSHNIVESYIPTKVRGDLIYPRICQEPQDGTYLSLAAFSGEAVETVAFPRHRQHHRKRSNRDTKSRLNNTIKPRKHPKPGREPCSQRL